MVNDLVYERGYVSPLFAETMYDEESGAGEKKEQAAASVCDLEQPLVLVVASRVTEVQEIAPILDLVKRA